jgi:hypothetical protein
VSDEPSVPRGTWLDGVFFCEAPLVGQTVQPVKAEISRQNANLGLVKSELARLARSKNANAVAQFRYGQRSHRPLELLKFKWDTESWFGEGIAMQVEPSSLPPQ